MSYLKNNLKKKLSKYSEVKASPIFIYGSDENYFLTTYCDHITSMTPRVKNHIEVLKKSACELKMSSLTSNQIFSLNSVFIINKHINNLSNSGPEGRNWFLLDKTPKDIDYDVFINPKITHVTKKLEKDIELCACFPFLKVRALRFNEIKVNYYDHEFEEKSEILTGFKARVFQHEFEHTKGMYFLDWRICQGEVEFQESAKNDYLNFGKALTKYKKTIDDIKKNFPDIMKYYEDDKNYVEDFEENGIKWYKYNWDAFREQPTWSKEEEVMKGMDKAATIDYNLVMVLFT